MSELDFEGDGNYCRVSQSRDKVQASVKTELPGCGEDTRKGRCQVSSQNVTVIWGV